jgi:hypothetical protein
MAISEMIQKLVTEKIVTITSAELDELISKSEVVEEKNTGTCGLIRIVVYGNHVIVQEQTDNNKLVVHLLESVNEAKTFVRDRLESYERMWDGCGCKIDYFP